MDIYFYRHGKTPGNAEYRYVGRTDEEVLPSWLAECESAKESVDFLFVSPMKRCRQTANVLFPNQEQIVIYDLKEMDFGDFEMKNYHDLDGNEDYQNWIDGGGVGAFPNGESREMFICRCVSGFQEAISMAMANDAKAIALVVHGGTIMAVMDQFSEPHKDYFEWGVKNGASIHVKLEEKDYERGKRKLKVVE